MVSKGQFLERPTLVPVGSLVMEGVSHRGTLSPLLLVLSPPPNEGGGMDHIVGAELAFAASSAGFPTLRFNYRGVGASQGARSSGQALVEDALAALEVSVDNARGGPVLVASINGSDAVALALRQRAEVAGVCLIGPTTSDPAQWPDDVWVVVGEHDNSLLRSAVTSSRARVEIVPEADRTFRRGLPLVGKTAVACLVEAATSRKH